MDKHIIPSIIAGSQAELDERIAKVKDLVDWIQLDVMDGRFVSNNSLDFKFTLPEMSCKVEAHLMVNDPVSWIDEHGSKVDTIIVHEESCRGQDKHNAIMEKMTTLKKRLGVAINPDTQEEMIQHCLDKVDFVLVMTVQPGTYGAKFIPEMLGKVKQLRSMKPDIDIEVDGGISIGTIKAASEAGANRFVVGSYIQDADDVKAAITALKKEVEKEHKKEGEKDRPDTAA